MYVLKCGITLLLIAVLAQNGHLISTGAGSQSDEILWNLSQYAVQNKQNLNKNYPSESQLHPEKFSRYVEKGMQKLAMYDNPKVNAKQNPAFSSYTYPGPYTYHQKFPLPPALPPGYQQQPQSFTSALQLIAQNDQLECVPRLLCELISGPSNDLKLPFNVDLDSVAKLLPFIGGIESSPILSFGKAVLLGYTSKGKTDSCVYAYPKCPKDPDQLVEYLNNYNGGFFRFFNGNLQQPQFDRYKHQPYPFTFAHYPRPQYYHHLQNQRQKIEGNRRIQNKPVQYVDNPTLSVFKFPNTFYQEDLPDSRFINFYNNVDGDFQENYFRKQKGIQFPSSYNTESNRPTIMVFPDRTGTGELILEDDGTILSSSEYVYFDK